MNKKEYTTPKTELVVIADALLDFPVNWSTENEGDIESKQNSFYFEDEEEEDGQKHSKNVWDEDL